MDAPKLKITIFIQIIKNSKHWEVFLIISKKPFRNCPPQTDKLAKNIKILEKIPRLGLAVDYSMLGLLTEGV